jgi:hypothetical protein
MVSEPVRPETWDSWAWFEISLGALLYILGDFNGFLCMNWGCKNLRFDYDRRF